MVSFIFANANEYVITSKVKSHMKKQVVIIGAGASGLMCAIEAGKRGRKVIVIDHSGSAGRKIFASGGGRCNFTNLNIGEENYISTNEGFVRSALARFTPDKITELLKKHNISYRHKTAGQLFCAGSSRQVVNMLMQECKKAGVTFLLNNKIETIEKKDATFIIKCGQKTFKADALVVATGGLSYPKLGASDFGYKIARQFGIKVTECRPALVPLRFGVSDMRIVGNLSGVSLKVKVTCNKQSFVDDMLFTHSGLSGPAILQISSYWRPGDVIILNLPSDQHLPRRLAGLDLHNWKLKPIGTMGYNEAEVTSGGVDTKEISSKTFESRKISGLYFIGEVLDVTGQLGGYNLHWAWASGFAAGQES